MADAVLKNQSAEAEFCRECFGVQSGGFLRFPKRSNTHFYHALAAPELNKA